MKIKKAKKQRRARGSMGGYLSRVLSEMECEEETDHLVIVFDLANGSNCGGVVAVALVYMATVPPVPTCRNCGATAKAPVGPVIEMEGGNPAARSEHLSDHHELLHNRGGKVEGVDR